jgi:hypothetical protein
MKAKMWEIFEGVLKYSPVTAGNAELDVLGVCDPHKKVVESGVVAAELIEAVKEECEFVVSQVCIHRGQKFESFLTFTMLNVDFVVEHRLFPSRRKHKWDEIRCLC